MFVLCVSRVGDTVTEQTNRPRVWVVTYGLIGNVAVGWVKALTKSHPPSHVQTHRSISRLAPDELPSVSEPGVTYIGERWRSLMKCMQLK